MRSYGFFLIFLILLSALQVDARTLSRQSFWADAPVLRIGEKSFKFQGSFSQRTSHTDSSSLLITPKMTLSSDQITKMNNSDIMKASVSLRRESTPLAERSFEYEIESYEFAPALYFGVTRSWNIGLKLPLIRQRLKTKVLTRYSGELNEFMNQKDIDLETKVFVQNNVDQAFDQNLTDNNFDLPEEETESTSLGDIELQSKYDFYKTQSLSLGLTQLIRLPTGKKKRHFELVDASTGDGQFDLGLGSSLNLYMSPVWRVNIAAMHTVQMPYKDEMRFEESRASRGQAPVLKEVSRDLGDISEVSLMSLNRIWKGVQFLLGYSYSHKTRDKYTHKGREFKLEKTKDQQIAQMGIDYSFRKRNSYNLALNMYSLVSSKEFDENMSTELSLSFNF